MCLADVKKKTSLIVRNKCVPRGKTQHQREKSALENWIVTRLLKVPQGLCSGEGRTENLFLPGRDYLVDSSLPRYDQVMVMRSSGLNFKVDLFTEAGWPRSQQPEGTREALLELY